jgi:hypothetical protein
MPKKSIKMNIERLINTQSDKVLDTTEKVFDFTYESKKNIL